MLIAYDFYVEKFYTVWLNKSVIKTKYKKISNFTKIGLGII